MAALGFVQAGDDELLEPRTPTSLLEPGRRPVYLARVRDRACVPPLEVHARHEYAGRWGSATTPLAELFGRGRCGSTHPAEAPLPGHQGCAGSVSRVQTGIVVTARASEIDLVGGRGEGCWIRRRGRALGVGGGQCVGTQARVAVVTVA